MTVPGTVVLAMTVPKSRSEVLLRVSGSRTTPFAIGFPVAVRVRQLTEHVQGDTGLIGRLKDAGVVPNARVTVQVTEHGNVLIVIPGHEQVELPHDMAHAVKVEKV